MTDRSLLADAIAGFLDARCTPDDVAEIEAGRDPAPLWAELEELGFTLVAVSEEAGGAGGSLVDALTVLRSAGRHAVPLPLAETGLLAAWILEAAGLPVVAGRATVAPVRTEDAFTLRRDGDGAIVSGRALRVPWARAAERIVVLAAGDDGRAYAATVAPAAARITAGASLAGEPRDALALDGVRLGPDAFAPVDLTFDDVLLRGALGRAVLMLGALERVRDLTVAWSKDREQFGRPIARFQAVQHLLAQMARDVALTRAAVELAAAAAGEEDGGGWLEVAAAKVVAGRAARTVTAQAHQVHGAIGMTREYSLTVLTRRLWAWRDEFGSEAEWSRRIAARLDESEGGVWALVTAGRLPLATARTA
ncbi:MAG TPA: acyl-CoA dehydrogenase family protein [Baekduia sp.]